MKTIALLLSLLASPALAQSDVDLGDWIHERVGASEAGEEQLWNLALELRSAARGNGGQSVAELERLLESGDLDTDGQLVAVAALLGGEEGDTEQLYQVLIGKIDHDPETAAAAVGLLSNTRFRTLPSETRVEASEKMLDIATSSDHAPLLRLRAARAAHVLGRGQDRRNARRELLDFLRSSDSEIRGSAALALAAIGDEITGPLASELERMSTLPGERGSLAMSYLARERSRRHADSKLRELERMYSEKRLPEELAQFNAVMQMVEKIHLDGDKVSRKELLDAALDGMLVAMDQHSSYMSPQTYSKFFQDLEAEYGGIGAYVGEDPNDGLFSIKRPIYSGPAYRAGLSTDDKIVRIGDWSTLGQPVDAIIKRLKGKPGTSVDLYVWRRGMDPGQIDRPTEDMIVTVVREQIEIPSVKVDMLPGHIGLVELRDFSRVASKEVREGLSQLKRQGMKSLIFDLRSNSGGLLPEAVNVADLFLPPDKDVVRTESRIYPSNTHRTRNEPFIDPDIPMVVLVDRYSASAAEIVAGALQDHGRAELVGERTFGKGSVQDLVKVFDTTDDEWRDENGNGRYDSWERLTKDHDGDGEFDFAPRVKITIAQYLLPSGRSIHRELDEDRNIVQDGGIEPDHEVQRERIDYWRLEEFDRINRKERAARQYVDDHWEAYQDLFRQLAYCDFKNPELYPDFAELYESLSTPLPEDDVRYLLRQAVRRRVQDARGSEFPFADFQEDAQAQRAITLLLEKLGQTPDQFKEFRETFENEDLERIYQPPLAALGELPSRQDLASSKALLLRARDGNGQLSPEELDRLLTLLSELPE